MRVFQVHCSMALREVFCGAPGTHRINSMVLAGSAFPIIGRPLWGGRHRGAARTSGAVPEGSFWRQLAPLWLNVGSAVSGKFDCGTRTRKKPQQNHNIDAVPLILGFVSKDTCGVTDFENRDTSGGFCEGNG